MDRRPVDRHATPPQRLRDVAEEAVRIASIEDAPSVSNLRRMGVVSTRIQRSWLAPADVPGRYRILAGHANVQRAAIAGHATIRAVITHGLSAEKHAFYAACDRAGNIAHHEILAIAMRGLAGMPDRQIAMVLGRQTADISRLRDLPAATPELRAALSTGEVTLGHARYLIPLEGPDQIDWLQRTIEHAWSVSELGERRRAARLNRTIQPATTQGSTKDPETVRFERMLSEQLGTDLQLQGTTIELTWHSVEQLQGVLARLGEAPPSEAGRAEAATPRRLVIPLNSLDELDAMLGHLYPSE